MMRSAWGQSLVSLVVVGSLSLLGCAPVAKPSLLYARSARSVEQAARSPPQQAPATADAAEDATAMPSLEALEALQAMFGGGGSISHEERHKTRIAMARAALVALNQAKLVQEEREDLETQLQRELEEHAVKSHASKAVAPEDGGDMP